MKETTDIDCKNCKHFRKSYSYGNGSCHHPNRPYPYGVDYAWGSYTACWHGRDFEKRTGPAQYRETNNDIQFTGYGKNNY